MKQLIRIYQLFSLLNLDVVAGAVGFVYTAVALFPVKIPTYQIVILSSTVWIIYTSDRLLDTFRNPQVLTTRHQFQYTNRKASLVVLFVLVAVNLLLFLIHKPMKLIMGGMLVSVFMLVYLLIKQGVSFRKKSFLLKEIFIACCYSMGIMLLPFSNCETWPGDWSLLMGYIFLIALINVFVIGSFEEKEDLLFGEKSMVHWIPSAWVVRLCILFSIMAIALAGMLFTHHPVTLALIALPILLLVPLFFREKFARHNLYRLWEDGMLMLPVPVLIFDSFL